MSWRALIELIAQEYGDDIAGHIEDRARKLMGGERIFVMKTKIITKERIDRAAAGRPKEAAKKLGVHQATIYRHLNKPTIR